MVVSGGGERVKFFKGFKKGFKEIAGNVIPKDWERVGHFVGGVIAFLLFPLGFWVFFFALLILAR